MKRLGTKSSKDNLENVTKKGRAEKNEVRTVLVSDLPEEVTENNVCIHFQKKKNGGGEVEKVEMLGGGKARIIFEESEGSCG